MKKQLLGICGLLAFANIASAQSVTVYGLLDTAVERISNVGPSGSGLTRMSALTGTTPSRLGFRGGEDLGGGLRTVFTFEMGVAPDTGTLNQGGRAFGRQSFVGLSGPWGTVSLGRHYTMYFWSLLDADTMGANLYGIGAFDAYINNARVDNSISYLGRFGGLTAGATFSLGRDAVNAGPSPAGTNCAGESALDSRACREWSLLLKYDSPNWGTAAAIDTQRGGPGAFGGLTSSARSDRRVSVNGYAKFGAVKVGAGLIRRDNQGSPFQKTDLWYASVGFPVMQDVVLDAGVSRYNVKNTSDKATLYAVRATYNLSKRSAVYATLGRVDNDGNLNVAVSGAQVGGNPSPGRGQTGYAVGIRHSF